MRDYKSEAKNRVEWIKEILTKSGAKGIIFGNSGGKDSALVGILCKMATDNVLGVIMPCASKQNYTSDKDDALKLADKFEINTKVVDLTDTRESLLEQFEANISISEIAKSNIAPRLRMTTLYAIGQTKGYLVAGTSNKSEYHMGYFTKWGDAGCDFNPIADLTATEIFKFLEYLNCPIEIIKKAPSAGLFDGQTDEMEMGVTYCAIDKYIETGKGREEDVAIIERMHKTSEHKRSLPLKFEN
ncbi:MAG: NAD(+) synthase [Defluviitaleaceae bacterium]|nr:NAD(+) synthase [Defluviitaleaceae bacterium]